FYVYDHHRDLHSFPTRRSSDLSGFRKTNNNLSMAQKEAYLIVDIGTGNARVGVVTPAGDILAIKRENVQYHADANYEESIYFNRSEEHTSELQSRENLVCRLLL